MPLLPALLGDQPPRAANRVPNLPRCACADLRFALSTSAVALVRWAGVRLSLRLLPPALRQEAFGTVWVPRLRRAEGTRPAPRLLMRTGKQRLLKNSPPEVQNQRIK